MKPDFVVDGEQFKSLLTRWMQSEDKNVHYFFDEGFFVCIIVSPNFNYWYVGVPFDNLIMADIKEKGQAVRGLFNLTLHTDVLNKLDEVKNCLQSRAT